MDSLVFGLSSVLLSSEMSSISGMLGGVSFFGVDGVSRSVIMSFGAVISLPDGF